MPASDAPSNGAPSTVVALNCNCSGMAATGVVTTGGDTTEACVVDATGGAAGAGSPPVLAQAVNARAAATAVTTKRDEHMKTSAMSG
ncbi:hypothetical protein MGALJ_60360 (plasmid) [Mycobacterium gallinarum]|uniref:Uncharacterized protein n=1 Tax=Mycobacterium gallinarum TaxID=39689 RepID=A0A9W4B9H3_9MYCO|nr:hypothetical protein MGALJ_60360 [Mycobacterium gallinarum]